MTPERLCGNALQQHLQIKATLVYLTLQTSLVLPYLVKKPNHMVRVLIANILQGQSNKALTQLMKCFCRHWQEQSDQGAYCWYHCINPCAILFVLLNTSNPVQLICVAKIPRRDLQIVGRSRIRGNYLISCFSQSSCKHASLALLNLSEMTRLDLPACWYFSHCHHRVHCHIVESEVENFFLETRRVSARCKIQLLGPAKLSAQDRANPCCSSSTWPRVPWLK